MLFESFNNSIRNYISSPQICLGDKPIVTYNGNTRYVTFSHRSMVAPALFEEVAYVVFPY